MHKIREIKRIAREALCEKTIGVIGKERSNWKHARLSWLLFKLFSGIVGFFIFLLILHSVYSFYVYSLHISQSNYVQWIFEYNISPPILIDSFFDFLYLLFDMFFDFHPQFFRFFWVIFFGNITAWLVLIIFAGLYSIFILSPIKHGHYLFYANIILGKRARVDDMFKPFSGELCKPIIVTVLLRRLFLMLWSMILVAVVVIGTLLIRRLTVYGFLFGRSDVMNYVAFALFIVAFFAAIILLIFKRFSYAMTEHIVLSNPEIAGTDAIDKSRQLMKGNKVKLFLLNASFIGWLCLSVLTLGILHIV